MSKKIEKICKNCKHWGIYSDGTLAEKRFISYYFGVVSNCEILGKMGHPGIRREDLKCDIEKLGDSAFEPLETKIKVKQ